MSDNQHNHKQPIRIGVLVPFTNTNLEADIMRMRYPNTSVHFTRIGGYDSDEIPDASQMQEMGEADITDALKLIAGVRPNIVLYGCTSATLTHGVKFDSRLADEIKTITGAKVVTAAGALCAGLQAIKARKIGFASPYVGKVNDQAVQFLADAGYETVKISDVGTELSSHDQGAMSPDDVYDLAIKADHKDADAIVMSCTDLRAVEVIERLEVALNKPVITSNQAMMYAVANAYGFTGQKPEFGRLFSCYTASTPKPEHFGER